MQGDGTTVLHGKGSLLATRKRKVINACFGKVRFIPPLYQLTKVWMMGLCQGLDSRPIKPVPSHGPQDFSGSCRCSSQN